MVNEGPYFVFLAGVYEVYKSFLFPSFPPAPIKYLFKYLFVLLLLPFYIFINISKG